MSTQRQTAELLAGMRQKALSVSASAGQMQGFYDHHVYSQAHLRKIKALCEELQSEMDFVQLAYQEGR